MSPLVGVLRGRVRVLATQGFAGELYYDAREQRGSDFLEAPRRIVGKQEGASAACCPVVVYPDINFFPETVFSLPRCLLSSLY